MPHSFQFELASPERVLVNKAVAMVTVPSEKGKYGVLIGHAPMITTVCAGVVEVFENDEATVSDRVFVEGGFAEVTGDRCTVLAERAVPVKEINRKAVEDELKLLEDATAAAETDEERDAIELRAAVLHAKLSALE